MWQEILRLIGRESPQEKAAREERERVLRERHRQQEEQFAEDSICQLHIFTQVDYSWLVQQMRGQAHQASGLSSDSARQSLARMRFDAMQTTGRFSDELLQLAEERLMSLVDASPQRRSEIRINALGKALNYWQGRLEQPDLTPEELTFGRQRATQLRARLTALTNPDTNPKA